MWKIAIDTRKINDYGIGTYIFNFLSNMPIDEKNFHYFLFGEIRNSELLKRPDFTFLPDKTPKYSIKEMWCIPHLLKSIQADLYHSPHYVLPIKKVCPVIVTIHDIIHLLFPNFLPSKKALVYAKFMMRNALLNSESIITVSQNSRRDLLKRYPTVPENKITVIYPGISKNTLRENIKRNGENINDNNGYILYVGSFKPHKNLITIIKAFAILKNNEKRKEKLVIVGEVSEKYPELLREAEQNGVLEYIIWEGYKTDAEIMQLYSNASVFVFPSIYEGFGLPPLEAMACGTPVLASSSASLPEVVGNAGILLDPMSPRVWAGAMLKVLTDKKMRQDLIRRGKIQADKFSSRKMAIQIRDVYQKTLEKI